MTIHKYSINNIFKLLLILGTIVSTSNFVWAGNDANNTKKEGSGENQELTNIEETEASEDNSVQQQTIDKEANSNDGEEAKASENQQFQSNNTVTSANQELFNLKNILLVFAIIDLPIIALLLTLWVLDRKEQKQKFDNLANEQSTIERQLKQLNKITLKLENSDKLQNKVVKEIEENKQEIINSRIEILAAFENKQSERVVNSNGSTDISLTKLNSPSFNKEQTEYQLDKHSHNSVAVIEQIPQFVDKYNLDKKSLSDKVIAIVVATQASLDNKRSGKSDLLTLELTTQKKYWIIQEDSDSYLVPHAKIKIDEYNKTTLESLFECINFSLDYTDFHLIEPAKVSQSDSELWQLEKKGKLEFS